MIWRAAVVCTVVAGTLDLSGAIILSSMTGRGPLLVLQSIAGTFLGKATYAGGATSAILGLLIHFAIMSVMVLTFVISAATTPVLMRSPAVAGMLYGLSLFLIMYWIVLPLRWPTIFPTSDAQTIIEQLAYLLLLVGLPTGLITAAMFGSPAKH